MMFVLLPWRDMARFMEGPLFRRFRLDGPRGSSSKRVAASVAEKLVRCADETFASVDKIFVKRSTERPDIRSSSAPNDGTQAVRNLLGIFRFQIVVDEQDHGMGRGIGRGKMNGCFF